MASRRDRNLAEAFEALQATALALPGAVEDYPWDHVAWKVRGKAFCFTNKPAGDLRFSVKLPHSSGAALLLPFAQPTGYGLGRSGWVTASFDGRAKLPVGLLEAWLLESYRAVAPKRLSAQLSR